jgi:hypothetical protein
VKFPWAIIGSNTFRLCGMDHSETLGLHTKIISQLETPTQLVRLGGCGSTMPTRHIRHLSEDTDDVVLLPRVRRPGYFDPEFMLFQSFVEGYISLTTPQLSDISAVLSFFLRQSTFTCTIDSSFPTQLSVKLGINTLVTIPYVAVEGRQKYLMTCPFHCG